MVNVAGACASLVSLEVSCTVMASAGWR